MLTEQIGYFERGAGKTMRRTEDASRVAGELLLRCGITPHLCGFEPLKEGVRITAERSRASIRPPLAELQPAVGGLCGERSPDHAMRDAISVGFLSTDEIHTRFFPYADRPSSTEFICTLAELVADRIAQNGRTV